jgi:hypothetical protein
LEYLGFLLEKLVQVLWKKRLVRVSVWAEGVVERDAVTA